MHDSRMTEGDVQRALKLWAEYQRQHDVSAQKGRAVGIDPVSERIWFGESIVDIGRQLDAEGIAPPLYFVRVGSNSYYHKGGRWCLRES